MKILFLLRSVDSTGMTTNALDLGEEFVRKGHSVYLLAGDVSSLEKESLAFLRDRFLKSGIKISFFTVSESKYKVITLYNYLRILLFCLAKIVFIRPQIVHSASPYMTIIPWILRKKYVWTVHVCDLQPKFTLRPSPLVITISDETSRYAAKRFHYAPSSLRKVLHGVHPRFSIPSTDLERRAFLQRNRISPDTIVVGSVGGIEERKGLDILLKGICLLPNELQSKLSVLIVGSEKYPGERAKLDSLISSLQLNSLVTICPHCDPKVAYDVMDVFVLPSRLEGFGLVVVEAMLSRCCIIRSDTEGAFDQIEHGKTGYLFKTEKFEELSNCLSLVLSDVSLRERIATQGYEYAKGVFLRDSMCSNTLKVYDEIVG